MWQTSSLNNLHLKRSRSICFSSSLSISLLFFFFFSFFWCVLYHLLQNLSFFCLRYRICRSTLRQFKFLTTQEAQSLLIKKSPSQKLIYCLRFYQQRLDLCIIGEHLCIIKAHTDRYVQCKLFSRWDASMYCKLVPRLLQPNFLQVYFLKLLATHCQDTLKVSINGMKIFDLYH